jgi:trehalose 6-phosphate phosphatase
MPVPALPVGSSLAQRLSGTPLLLLLDVDGTLSPIAPRPADAVVPDETRRVLRELVSLPGVVVAIVTGRGVDDARRMVEVPGIWVIGNHGFELARPDGPATARADVAPWENALDRAGRDAEAATGAHTGAFVENKRWTLSVHYRLADRRVVAELISATSAIAAAHGLRVTHGREVIEVRPPLDVDKGVAALDLARSVGALDEDASLFYAGDDRTDEDAFRALRQVRPTSVTVRVGDEPLRDGGATGAEFSVPDTYEMRELLEFVLCARRNE